MSGRITKTGSQDIPVWTYLIIALFFAIFIVVGIFLVKSYNHKKEICTVKAEATVIENRKIKTTRRSGKNHRKKTSTGYAPVYSYKYEGTEYTLKSSTSTNPPLFDVGETVEIYINPDNPKEIFVPRDKTEYIVGMIFSIGGTVIGIIVFIVLLKQSKGR